MKYSSSNHIIKRIFLFFSLLTFTLTAYAQTDPFRFIVVPSNEDCRGLSSGSLTLTALGGTPPYQYTIDNGVTWSNSGTFLGLAAGTYQVGTKDADDDTYLGSVSIGIYPNIKGQSYSDAPISYGVASHSFKYCLFLGTVDAAKVQAFPYPSINANTALNDDGFNNGVVPVDADGFVDLTHAKINLAADGTLTVKVHASATARDGKMQAWIDFNRNGLFDSNEVSTSVPVPDGSDQEFDLVWTDAASKMRNGITYLRVRIFDGSISSINPTEGLSVGEVEDYKLNLNTYSISKSVMAKHTGSDMHASIGETLLYTLELKNNLPVDATIDVFDPIPFNTDYLEGTASDVGVLGTATVNGVSVPAIVWNSLSIPANSTMYLNFEVRPFAAPTQLQNIAYAVKGLDTINSADNCKITIIQMTPVMAEDDCAATLVNTSLSNINIAANDDDPDRHILTTNIYKNGNNGTATINYSDGSLNYVPNAGFSGLDTIGYEIAAPTTNQADAEVHIAVLKPTKPEFVGCANASITIGVEPIATVKFDWYTEATGGTAFAANTNTATINMGENDTVFYVEVKLTSCTTSRLPISVKVLKTFKLADVRVEVCTTPNRAINLSSYVDTSHITSISWVQRSGMPITADGKINTNGMGNAVQAYKYKVMSHCGPDSAVVYVKTIKNEPLNEITKTVVVCHKITQLLSLQQALGLDASANYLGSWTYSDPNAANHINVASLAPFTGAMLFDPVGAFLAGVGTVVTHGADIAARKIELTYTSDAASCIGAQTHTLTIILTNDLVN